MNFDVSKITGLTADSRQVRDGFLFIALPGTKINGADYIADAILKGAKFIAAPKNSVRQTIPSDVEWLDIDNPRQFLSKTAAAFYRNQPQNIVAVTGTNGKTSTVNFARMIWNACGIKSASLGTLGLIGDGLEGYAGMTTPDPVTLFSNLNDVTCKGISHLAMEASSHGLHQHRLDDVNISAAGFTNLTRDHLDYHGSMDNYLESKIRLFTEILRKDGTAVLNADIPEFIQISNRVKAHHINMISYGFSKDADIRVLSRNSVVTGQDLKLRVLGQDYQIHLGLVGAFQMMNVLCAVGLVMADKKIPVDKIMSVLPSLQGVVGRLQSVPHRLENVGIYIDYAHTPDGLETILNALRPHTTGRLICVFGCGGDRDKGKRPMMGEIATRLSDMVIVTDDNPRSEDPAMIRADILSAAPNAIEVDGRRNAIQIAVQQLKVGDVLVLAGKGHEQGQIFATHTEPFDEFTEVQIALTKSFP